MYSNPTEVKSMYTSMTGFSSTSKTMEWGTITLDLSSVNHRYQEIYVRLPKELSSWEPWFHRKLREAFRRGKVQAKVEILWAVGSLACSIDREALLLYYNELAEARNEIGQQEDIALESLLGLPGVLDTQGRMRHTRGDETEEMLSGLLAAGVESWNEMRRQEGSHLEEAVLAHLRELEDLTGKIAGMWGSAKDAAFAVMLERVRKVLDAVGAAVTDDSRFTQEAVFIADRWDVSEELARLKSHIEKFRHAGKAGSAKEPNGRKLDFLVQEMNREVNTLDSKVADADIRWLAVEAKSVLERIREQIQNLE